MTAVKICGITNVEDAITAARVGVHALGFVFYAGSARHVAPEHAAEIARRIPPFVTVVGLFVNAVRGEVARVIEQVPIDLLQFHGEEDADFCAGFRVPYIKAVRVRPGLDLLQYARSYASARGLLLDAYVEGKRGGTGVAFDWSLIPRDLSLPVILSGGLDPQNVCGAIHAVQPWAVDVSSGVESRPGAKDARKMAAFLQGVRNADV